MTTEDNKREWLSDDTSLIVTSKEGEEPEVIKGIQDVSLEVEDGGREPIGIAREYNGSFTIAEVEDPELVTEARDRLVHAEAQRMDQMLCRAILIGYALGQCHGNNK